MSRLDQMNDDQSPACNELVAWLQGVKLTKRQAEILTAMRDAPAGDDEGELVYERGMGYLGTRRVSATTVMAFLRYCAISPDSTTEVGGVERYHINGTGRQLLDAHEKGRL